MNGRKQAPGPVLEDAEPIEGRGHRRSGKETGETGFEGEGREEQRRSGSAAIRTPGPVEQPSEPVAEPQEARQLWDEQIASSTGGGLWGRVFWLAILFVGAWLFNGAISALIANWDESIWLGLPLSLLAAAFFITLLWAGFREYRAWRRVDALALRAERIDKARRSKDLDGVRRALDATVASLRAQRPELIAEFDAAAEQRVTSEDYLALFDNLVLTGLDREADEVVNKVALSTGAAVAVVPHPALDAAVVLWRATRLVRDIGRIYGLAPTGLSSLRLLKYTITTAILVAGMEAAGSLVLGEAGRGVLEGAGKRLTEGAIAVTRLRRLGKTAQRLCRPIPRVGVLREDESRAGHAQRPNG